MKNFRRAAGIWALLIVAASIPTFAGGKTATIKLVNQTQWEIHHIYFSPSDEAQWGEDHLGDEVLGKGDSLTITDIECAEWDMKIVDEDGDSCVIEEIEFCGEEEAVWKITDKHLLACEGYR